MKNGNTGEKSTFEALSAKESLLNGCSVAITVLFGTMFLPFMLIIPINWIMFAGASIIVSTIMYLNIRKQRIVKQYRIVSLVRTVIDGFLGSALVIAPVMSVYSAKTAAHRRIVEKLPGHSTGVEYLLPFLIYAVLILPAILPQIITTVVINKRLRRLETEENREKNAEDV